jgi:hypothetical protein
MSELKSILVKTLKIELHNFSTLKFRNSLNLTRRRLNMAVIDMVAKELHMKPKELLKESLRTYLEKRLSKLEADIFLLTKKYGVKDVFEFDSKVKEGFIRESDGYEDYFAFDNFEAEREKIKKFLEKL